jgi:lipopolysaccharide biosynthesis glycosyltransferase
MLLSVAESAVRPSRWYLVGDESVAPAVLQRLVDFARDCGLAAEPFRIPDHLLAPFEDQARYPRVVWSRAVLAEALSHENRLVYLDSDVLVLQDVEALWSAELGDGDLFAAVSHPSYAAGADHCARLGLAADAPVFNSGVMVMDLLRMRAERFAERTLEFVRRPGRPQLRFADQDAMNAVFAGRWTDLDPKWNCMSSMVQPFLLDATWEDDAHHDGFVLERAARSPAIVHFEGLAVMRPWNRRCFNPFADLYRGYRARTPWPLDELQGGWRDAVIARVPPRVQAKVWSLRRRQVT